MAPSRLPRFRRKPPTTPIQLTERDRSIIRVVHRHRLLRSTQIAALLDDSSQQLLRRLQSLYHHGYLERPRAQIDYYHQVGSKPIVYGLGSKSTSLLQEEFGAAFRKLPWGEKNRAVGRIFLEHALLVSDVMVAIELACRRNGNLRLLYLDDPALNKKPRWRVTINSRIQMGVIPDRVFALEFSNQNNQRSQILFFLEADRGTMPVIRQSLTQTSFYRKLLAYEATWSRGIHRKRFGVGRFKVLTVTSAEVRVTSLVNACSRLERGHGLFLFADRSVLSRTDILSSKLWTSGRNGQPEGMLD